MARRSWRPSPSRARIVSCRDLLIMSKYLERILPRRNATPLDKGMKQTD
jgi:hypothetical protein